MDIVKGLLAEIRPIPMSLMLLTTLLGGLFAAIQHSSFNPKIMFLVILNAFLFLYVAHCNDTFYDIKKGEYEKERKLHAIRMEENSYLPRWGFGPEIPDAPLLKPDIYLHTIILCSLLGTALMIYISLQIRFFYSALAIVGLILALTYSAGLDRVPALGDTMWEVGVIFALFCGYYSQRLVLDLPIVIFSLPLFISLIGIKALDSYYDIPTDNKTEKITLPVYLYRRGWSLERIRDLGYLFLYICFIFIYIIAPKLIFGIMIASIIIFVSHLSLRKKDMSVRLGVVFAGLGILAFILYAIEKFLLWG